LSHSRRAPRGDLAALATAGMPRSPTPTSPSAAGKRPAGQLPGSGPERGPAGGFEGLEVQHPSPKQTVAERVKAVLYTLVAAGEVSDNSGQLALLDLQLVEEVLLATRIVRAKLRSTQPAKLMAARIGEFTAAFAYALADQLGCALVLVREGGIEGSKIAGCIKIGKNVIARHERGHRDFPNCSRAAFENITSAARPRRRVQRWNFGGWAVRRARARQRHSANSRCPTKRTLLCSS